MLPASVCGGVSRGLMYRCATLSPYHQMSWEKQCSCYEFVFLWQSETWSTVLASANNSKENILTRNTLGLDYWWHFYRKTPPSFYEWCFFMHIGQINHIYTKQICILYRQVLPTSLDSVFYHMPVVVTTQTFQALTVKAVNFTPSNNNNHKHVTREKI